MFPSYPTFSPGQAVPASALFECRPAPWIPSGLVYRVTFEIKLTDPTFRIVDETHRQSHLLVAGFEWWEEVKGSFACNLTPPGSGDYVVLYELHVTDLFGRSSLSAEASGGFQVDELPGK
jgi:hypothetical protein